MGIYINGIGAISPVRFFGNNSLLGEVEGNSATRINCMEPDYTGLIDQKSIRRMSRIIRMGVASAFLALKDAAVSKPDAIITGTAFGCLEDTDTFLTKMIVNKEQALNPTPFMQSTHNTMGSQIALLLDCTGYNQTYVHRAFSFESALIDAMMMMEENGEQHILAGGMDEITDVSHKILSRFGLFRKGRRQGEGSSFFLLSGRQEKNSYALLKKVFTIYKPESCEVLRDKYELFLKEQLLTPDDIDLVLTGNPKVSIGSDHGENLFRNNLQINFKNLCGEYPTSGAFALWLGAMILRNQIIPANMLMDPPTPIKNILIQNSYFGIHCSLILIQTC